jgi:hypothetical protein
MIRDLQYELAPGADATFKNYIEKRRTMPFFSNARTVRLALARVGARLPYACGANRVLLHARGLFWRSLRRRCAMPWTARA